LTAQYIQLKAPSAEATKQIKDLSDALKKQEGAIGDNRRSVGGYKDAIVSAFNEIKVGGVAISNVVDPLKNLGAAFGTAGTGVKGFAGALATTGLPLIIIGVNSLIEAFRTFEPLAEAVEQVMGGISSAFTSSYDSGVKLVKMKQDLEDLDRNTIVTNALIRKQINELEAIAAGKARTDEERIAATEKANALRLQQVEIERTAAKAEVAIQQEAVRQAEQSARTKAGFLTAIGFATEVQVNDDILKAREEAIAKQIDIDDKYNQAVIANDNLLLRLRKPEEEKTVKLKQKTSNEVIKIKEVELKSLEDILAKEQVAKDKAFEEDTNRLLDAEVKSAQITANRVGSINARVDAELIARNRLLQNEQLNETERQNIIRESEDKIAKIKQDAAKQQIDIEKKKQDETIARIQYGLTQASNTLGLISQALQQGSQERLDSFKSNAEAEKKTLENQFKHGEISKKKYNQELARIDADARKKESDEKRKQWEIAKGIQITNAVIQTAQAVLSAYSSGVAYPLIGPATGAVFAAIAGALGAVQIGIIAAQQPPKFALGGKAYDIGGKAHSSGGTPIHVNGEYVAEAEDGEGLFIMKRDAYQAGKLSNWNQLYGGNSWGVNTNFAALGGAIPIVESDGGYTARDSARNSDMAMVMQNAIREGFAMAPAPKLSIVEFETKQASRNRSVNVSES